MKTLIASIFVFGLLIFFHEFGHFLAARANGIQVLELAIGFGPKIFGWKKKGTAYSLRLFPLGGYCRLLGENPEEAGKPGSFTQKSPARRAVVLAAGSAMNLLLALLLFFIIFYFFVGVQQPDRSIIGLVIPETPAEKAGLQSGDEITAINGEPVENWNEIVRAIEGHPGEEISLVVKRNGVIKEFHLTAEADLDGNGKIGIGPLMQKYQFWGALGTSFERFGMIVASIFQVLTGQAPLDVTGPVGIIKIVSEVAETGFVNLLWLTGLISISLGLINILPIPALDGGRLFFLLIEALRGQPLDPEKEGLIHFIGFLLLILLILLVTYNDLIRWDILPGR
ncbi:MAG: RIP metalloprotease RseP [Dethiobacteria bacterium]|nr:RIP metalloprotease RseP [Bacillota bacterium]HOB29401.1 RIP metalloprotease RseP [Bacillota bacterium]HPZ42004.1 RIP metalloprotease RseP [Bacillota bacterium]HQD52907.1 RIP metalloprotease RseP [Bacillota bacterium]